MTARDRYGDVIEDATESRESLGLSRRHEHQASPQATHAGIAACRAALSQIGADTEIMCASTLGGQCEDLVVADGIYCNRHTDRLGGPVQGEFS